MDCVDVASVLLEDAENWRELAVKAGAVMLAMFVVVSSTSAAKCSGAHRVASPPRVA